MTREDLLDLHDRFLEGAPGSCAICAAQAFAWVDPQEIDCHCQSRYDAWHFLWLDAEGVRPHGYICDDCIDRLKQQGRIECYYTEMGGPKDELSDAGAIVAFQLGAARMKAVLALKPDVAGVVQAAARDALPFTMLGCRGRYRPLPHWQLIEYEGRVGSRYGDPETAGRHHGLVKAASGLTEQTDFSAEAQEWVAAEKQCRAREIERIDVDELFQEDVERMIAANPKQRKRGRLPS